MWLARGPEKRMADTSAAFMGTAKKKSHPLLMLEQLGRRSAVKEHHQKQKVSFKQTQEIDSFGTLLVRF